MQSTWTSQHMKSFSFIKERFIILHIYHVHLLGILSRYIIAIVSRQAGICCLESVIRSQVNEDNTKLVLHGSVESRRICRLSFLTRIYN